MNKILNSLDGLELDRIRDQLTLVELLPRQNIYRIGSLAKYAYFPTSSVISILCTMADGRSLEVASVGCEGFLESPLCIGEGISNREAIVSVGGYALMIPREALRVEFSRQGQFAALTLQHAKALMDMTSQLALCTRFHSVSQQLSRWLLVALYRHNDLSMILTQNSIATALGTRRESITSAARQMKLLGMIDYSRGHMTIIDRQALESITCECYQVIRKGFTETQAKAL